MVVAFLRRLEAKEANRISEALQDLKRVRPDIRTNIEDNYRLGSGQLFLDMIDNPPFALI